MVGCVWRGPHPFRGASWDVDDIDETRCECMLRVVAMFVCGPRLSLLGDVVALNPISPSSLSVSSSTS